MSTKIREIAVACHAGACNVRGLLRSLGEAMAEFQGRPEDSLELKYVIGQVSYLIGESLGPSTETVEKFSRELSGESQHEGERVEKRDIDSICETIKGLKLAHKQAKAYKPTLKDMGVA
jgi:hypothetical protein